MAERIKKRNIANYTGGVETADGRRLYGMDAENYLKVIRDNHLFYNIQLHNVLSGVISSCEKV